MSLADYVAYLRDYAAHFGILDRIRFNVKALLMFSGRVSFTGCLQVLEGFHGVSGVTRVYRSGSPKP